MMVRCTRFALVLLVVTALDLCWLRRFLGSLLRVAYHIRSSEPAHGEKGLPSRPMPAGRGTRSAHSHRAVGASGGAAAAGGSAVLVVRGQRHKNWGRAGCMPDMEGRVDSH
jgi:hypothetical protein